MGFFDRPELVSPGSDNVRLVELERRVAALEAQLAAVLRSPFDAQGAPAATVDPTWLGDVRALAARGKKIEAIKVYRDHTGVGLKEAKDAVDAMPR